MNPTAETSPDEAPESSPINIVVRCRPLASLERAHNDISLVHVIDTKTVLLLDPSPDEMFKNRPKSKQYTFDCSLGEESTQVQVFERTARPLVEGTLNGFNCTIFAYGATSAGKTYTMIGDRHAPGLMYTTFLELFSGMDGYSNRDYSVKLSYLEIYNEGLRDLFRVSDNLELREDKDKGLVVSGLSYIEPSNPKEVLKAIRDGNKRRTCEPTQANKTSSRSHAVLQILTEHLTRDNRQIVSGKMSLIDLAGSERAAKTKNRGLRMIEGANINRSLLALGNCINALCEMKGHVPYRDSKLTRLLKDSLGGNCRTVMIACISPFTGAYEETHNTLEYANRAKNIKTHAQKNVSSMHVAKYNEIIATLRQEIMNLKSQIAGPKNEFKVEVYMIDLNKHFSREAKIRKEICQQEKLIDQQIYNKIEMLKNDGKGVEEVQRKLDNLNSELVNKQKNLEKLILHRKELRNSWKSVPEPHYSQLNVHMKSNIIHMNKLELDRRQAHNEEMTKQRDLLLGLLNSNINTPKGSSPKLPLINKRQPRFIANSHLKSTEGINLPSIDTSKIPKPRGSSMNTPEHKSSNQLNSYFLNRDHMKQLKQRKGSGDVPVAEKFENHPYVLNSLKAIQARKARKRN